MPYPLIRPPAIIGSGDTVLTQSVVRALRGAGIAVVSPAGTERLVSLCFVEGLANLALAALRRGPLNDAVHAVDVELRLGELIKHYASALGVRSRISVVGASAARSRRGDAGYSWLVASSLAGQHYRQRIRTRSSVSRRAFQHATWSVPLSGGCKQAFGFCGHDTHPS